MNFISPPPLQHGDVIGIIAPARKVSKQELAPAIALLQEWGLKVLEGDNLYGDTHQFSGSSMERADDFNAMLSNPEVKAILCARGGYGSVQLLNHVNFNLMKHQPKWVVGFSDITVFHIVLGGQLGIESIHSLMPINFPKNKKSNASSESLRKVLFGELPSYKTAHHPLNRRGTAQGKLVGGNLSILYSLSGTDVDIDTNGKILLIEDIDEYLYHIDRMMMNLKRGGKLQGLKGLIVGGMTDMNDNTIPYGKSAEEIIRIAVDEYDFPVCFGFPAGHQEENFALIMGRDITLEVNAHECLVKFCSKG